MIHKLRAELGVQMGFGNSHPHRGGKPLPERSGGHLDTDVGLVLGVPGGAGAELPEVLELLHPQPESAQVEQGVEEHRAVPVGENKAVAIRP